MHPRELGNWLPIDTA